MPFGRLTVPSINQDYSGLVMFDGNSTLRIVGTWCRIRQAAIYVSDGHRREDFQHLFNYIFYIYILYIYILYIIYYILYQFKFLFCQGSFVLADSGAVYDRTHYGGRTGVFVFSQSQVTFSNLKYRCLTVIPRA